MPKNVPNNPNDKNAKKQFQRNDLGSNQSNKRDDDIQRSCNYEEKNRSEWQQTTKSSHPGCSCEGTKKSGGNPYASSFNSDRKNPLKNEFSKDSAPRRGNGDDDEDEELEPEEEETEENASNFKNKNRNPNDSNRRF